MKKASVLALAALSAFALSACDMLDPNQSSRNQAAPAAAGNKAPAGAASSAPASTGPASSSPAAAGPGIKVAAVTDLGEIITTAKGATLYLFTKDTNKPAKPTCYAACAQKWPPYMYSETLTVAGVDKALIGKVQRTDGSWQLTVNGWPTYTLAGEKPGETKGQGSGQSWYAITPQGKKAAGAPAGY